MKKEDMKKLAGQFYTVMYRTRRFEEEVFEFYKRGLMPGLAHLYLGEEAVATGACGALNATDYIASTHRGHGHLVARGADLNRMMAEILGKATGYSKGKGGSMHIMAMDKGILGANGIVGGGIPIALGAAYASKLMKTGKVCLSFFGDSASNEGTFHESLNMAAAWDLPVV
ncbi:MAG: thiamine pyrophosphate-dependent dehydrogenase E1 component subunit alpha, partial [Deltaproteobacteria bacterium]|nr:thiamine pyrophosphate-dependent dehydrogenase E1 component subunit alpha [Deltaproteobacteria bacterium]